MTAPFVRRPAQPAQTGVHSAALQAHRQDVTTSLGLLALRVGVGCFMASHGWGKLQMALAGAEFADPIGIGTTASLWLVVIAELVCALLVVVGLATRFAAPLVVFAMGVAAFVVHGADPWSMETAARLGSPASKEPALLYLIPFLALALTGAGRYSLDAWIAGRRAATPA
jgi:putative oxidoreductase